MFVGRTNYMPVNVLCACVCAKSLQSCLTLCNPMDLGPLSMGFSRQEYWSGLPLPSPMCYTLLYYYLIFSLL